MSISSIKLPTQEYLVVRFSYEEDTGTLRWKEVLPEDWRLSESGRKKFNTRHSGEVAGHIFKGSSNQLSTQVRVDGKSYYVHRIIWKIMTGEEPNTIDHIDGNPLNNKWNNLRDTDNLGNCKNFKKNKNNSSGYTGISWNKASGKWEAYIWHECKKYNLGFHTDIEDAIAIRKEKEVEFGYHENHGTDRDFTNIQFAIDAIQE